MHTRMVKLPNVQDLSNRWIGLEQFFPQLSAVGQNPNYPPYNIEKIGESDYRIVVAVAGFSADTLAVELKDSDLIIRDVSESVDNDTYKDLGGLAPVGHDNVSYIHRGIARRSFVLKFHLSPEIVVDTSEYVNGLLTVNLHREVPEAKRPRLIKINS